MRAEDAQGTPNQSHISPSIILYADIRIPTFAEKCLGLGVRGVRLRGGLVLKVYRLLHHSTIGLKVIKKKKFGVSGLPGT